ncbi:MAG: matrixin family metalloprotease [Nocardioides sp.]|nr:matrixin family metalloprotease [Nocardioides sp.]
MRRLLLVVLTTLGLLLAPLTTVTASAAPEKDASAKDKSDDAVSAAAKTRIRAHIPRGRHRLGSRAPITGHVSGPRRIVKIQVRTQRGFIVLGKTRTNKRHKFRINAPTWWAATQKLRVFVPRHGRFAPQVSRVRVMNVPIGYRPRGNKAFGYLDTRATRWNPCRIITYRINPRRAPRHGIKDIHRGIRKLSNATGLRFRYLGRTKELPVHKNKVHFRSDMVLGYGNARLVPQLRGGVIGIGGFTRGNTGAGFGITSGFVVFDAKARLRPGYAGGRATWGKVILHELAHSVGLAHVNNRKNLMYPAILRAGPSRYGRGDLRGLRAMGAKRGCLPRGGSRLEEKTFMDSDLRIGK